MLLGGVWEFYEKREGKERKSCPSAKASLSSTAPQVSHNLFSPRDKTPGSTSCHSPDRRKNHVHCEMAHIYFNAAKKRISFEINNLVKLHWQTGGRTTLFWWTAMETLWAEQRIRKAYISKQIGQCYHCMYIPRQTKVRRAHPYASTYFIWRHSTSLATPAAATQLKYYSSMQTKGKISLKILGIYTTLASFLSSQ